LSGPVIYITGGVRSGKSAFAQSLAEQQQGALLYVATAQAGDEEMRERIRQHRAARGDRWKTLEEPLALVDRLPAAAAGVSGVLLDCVTLWLTNLLLDLDEDPQRVLAEVDRLIAVLPHISAPVHIVTNEVGYGIVPENRLARIFRDLAGEANQRLAAASSEAWLVVSGLPVRLK
jgi:adenosylcobinamide kinase / adenosylcobinamide-phosphate guanylyltransferase